MWQAFFFFLVLFFYFLRIFAAAKCAAAESESKVCSVSPQRAMRISLVTLLSPCYAVLIRFCTLETEIMQAILASLVHSW